MSSAQLQHNTVLATLVRRALNTGGKSMTRAERRALVWALSCIPDNRPTPWQMVQAAHEIACTQPNSVSAFLAEALLAHANQDRKGA